MRVERVMKEQWKRRLTAVSLIVTLGTGAGAMLQAQQEEMSGNSGGGIYGTEEQTSRELNQTETELTEETVSIDRTTTETKLNSRENEKEQPAPNETADGKSKKTAGGKRTNPFRCRCRRHPHYKRRGFRGRARFGGDKSESKRVLDSGYNVVK